MDEHTLTYIRPMAGKTTETLIGSQVQTSVVIYVNNFEKEVREVYNSLTAGLERTHEDFEIIFGTKNENSRKVYYSKYFLIYLWVR